MDCEGSLHSHQDETVLIFASVKASLHSYKKNKILSKNVNNFVNKRYRKSPSFFVFCLWTFSQFSCTLGAGLLDFLNHRITRPGRDLQDHLVQSTPQHLSNHPYWPYPIISHHIPKCHIYVPLKHFQTQWLPPPEEAYLNAQPLFQ